MFPLLYTQADRPFLGIENVTRDVLVCGECELPVEHDGAHEWTDFNGRSWKGTPR